MVAFHESLDIIEYPDKGTLCTTARTESQTGEPLYTFFRIADQFDRDAQRCPGLRPAGM